MLDIKHRLKSRKEIDQVFQKGRTCYSQFLFLKYLPNSKPVSRFAFSIGLKFSKKAVERNRAKRLLREAVQTNLSQIKPGFDCVFFVKNVKPAELTLEILLKHVEHIFNRARLEN